MKNYTKFVAGLYFGNGALLGLVFLTILTFPLLLLVADWATLPNALFGFALTLGMFVFAPALFLLFAKMVEDLL